MHPSHFNYFSDHQSVLGIRAATTYNGLWIVFTVAYPDSDAQCSIVDMVCCRVVYYNIQGGMNCFHSHKIIWSWL